MAQQVPIPEYRPKDPGLRFDRCCGACGQIYGPVEIHDCDLDDRDDEARMESSLSECTPAELAELRAEQAWMDDEATVDYHERHDHGWADVAEWLGLNPGSGE